MEHFISPRRLGDFKNQFQTKIIAPINDDLSAQRKRLHNLESAAQGKIMETQTDSTEAYQKTVPSGALDYARLTKWGGKSFVFQQFCAPLEQGKYTTTNATISSFSDGVVTYTPSAKNGGINTVPFYRFNVRYDHVCCITCKVKSLDRQRLWGIGGYLSVYSTGSGEFETLFAVGTIPADRTSTEYIQILCQEETDFHEVQATDLMVFDLTELALWSTPTSVTLPVFKEKLPADYYPYTTSAEVLSAQLTNIKSVGVNICDGKSYLGGIYSSQIRLVSPITEIVSPFTTQGTYQGVAFAFPVEKGKTYTVSSDTVADYEHRISFFESLEKATSNSNILATANTATFESPVNGIAVCAYVKSASGSQISWTKFQAELGSASTDYKPYMLATKTLPTGLPELHSAGSVSDTIDWVDGRAIYTKRVGVVDLGTLTWNRTSYNAVYYFYATLSDSAVDASRIHSICAKYVAVNASSISKLVDKTHRIFTNKYLHVRDDSYTDATAFKTAMDGVQLYYELATPVETDITDLLGADNTLRVESGGTVTMGYQTELADMHVPIQNTEQYEIDLPLALEQGA